MKSFIPLIFFIPFIALADISPEKLADIREKALELAINFHKGKNPSTIQLLNTARDFEDFLLNKKVAYKNKENLQDDEISLTDTKIYKKKNKSKKISNFEGYSLGINLQNRSTTAKVTGDVSKGGTTYRASLDGIGQLDLIGDIAFDYGFKINNDIVILLGMNYEINDAQILDFSGALNRGGSKASVDGSINVDEKNHFSIYAAPGYEISENVLGFMKVAYHQFKIETSNSFNFTDGDATVHGYGVGFGMRSQVTNNLFGEISVQRVMYSDDSVTSRNLGTGSTIGLAGLYYNFDNKSKILFDSAAVNFKGLNIGFTGEIKSTLSELSVGQTLSDGDALSNIGSTFDSAGRQNFASSIYADYTIPLAHRTFLMTGGSFSLGKNETVKISDSKNNSTKLEEDDHFSIFVSPAYQLSNNSLGYIKFSYHDASLKLDNSSLSNNALGKALSSYSEDIKGYGIGFGLRSQVFENIYTDVEIQKIFYGNESISQHALTSIDVDSAIANFGLSYKY